MRRGLEVGGGGNDLLQTFSRRPRPPLKSGLSPSGPTSPRKLVARGLPLAEAISAATPKHAGPGATAEQWRELNAAASGVPTCLLQYLEQGGVTDLLVNDGSVWVDRGLGLERTDTTLGSVDQVRQVAVRMAAAAGRRLDDASPVVDAVLDGKYRLHAVLPPISKDGPAISIRVIASKPFRLSDLVKSGSVHSRVAQLLRQDVEQKRSILISGGTGAGKTTLLASLLALVPPDQRLICIEEASELVIDHPHVVHLQSRDTNVEGSGGLGLPELVRAAVRMRPDRLILGECRGAEVREVLTAMNTGHQGGAATIHANSVHDVPARLVALASLGGLSPETTTLLAASAFDRVVHVSQNARGLRYVSALGTLSAQEGALVGVEQVRVTGDGLLDADNL